MTVLRRVLAALVSVLALAGAVRLVAPATPDPSGVRRQLAFIRAALDDGAATDAQSLFPEGFYFMNVLYGLSWVELGQRGVSVAQAASEAAWALEQVESPAGRAPFDPGATPAYGVFYAGWTNWLRGGLLTLHDDPAQRARFLADSAALADAFEASSTPFLEAYPGQAWPCDSTVAIASLRLAARFDPRFAPVVSRWVSQARERLDPATGLLPHAVTPAFAGSRGTSQAIIQRFLVDVDPVFAREQYSLFRSRFLDRPLGLGPAVREYPHGTDGPADVDSGPLPLGISLSTTVVALGAAQVHGDTSLAGGYASFGEFAGLPIDTPSTKRYAFGLVPIGDAFLAWSKTARPWTVPVPDPPPPAISGWWRAPLLTLLLLIGLAPWGPVIVRRVRAMASPSAGRRP
ncbi:hypothetical protein J2S43_004352 [Catenuloplanes nepalensis]|uniref:Uncharacterized protein n=1 Tax=Catenuloplanes nepalensis TaxID=587533 RepID=A0ABT9MWT3_9ACTN|nr:hypothetical protein [Catenuloplanes nepalensis]MDP9795840.1 hypothetical protein [Catenuloplanes nepalensis]